MIRTLRAARVAWWLEWPYESWWSWLRGLGLLAEMGRWPAGAAEAAAGPLPDGARVLVVQLGHLGDFLQMAPMVQSLRRQRPDLRVDGLLGPWTEGLARRYACFDEVLVYAPDFAQFHRGDRRAVRPLWSERTFLRGLRGRGYATAISTAPPHLAHQMALRAAGAARTVGAAGGLAEFPLGGRDARRPYDSALPEAAWYASFLADLGLSVAVERPSFPVQAAEHAHAEQLLAGQPHPRLAIAPGAGWEGKCWPVERFAALAEAWRSRRGGAVVILGSPAERPLAQALQAGLRRAALDLTGATSLGESAAVLARCEVFAGNDSAPMHLAAAMGTATVSFFGPTRASKWAPAGPGHRVLQSDQPCDGCLYWHCRARCAHDGRCLKAITVEQAVAAVEAAWAEAAPGRAGTRT